MTTVATEAPRRWVPIAQEAAVAFGVAALYLASCLLIRVYPMSRLGQISGLASLALRFTVVGLALIVALVLANRVRGGRGFERMSNLVCAAIAGLATAMVGGGIMVALHGTPWGLNGMGGDAGAIVTWAEALHRGESVPVMYPPLPLHTLHLYSDLLGIPAGYAMKQLEIMGTAAFGPVAYLSWRLLLRPMWALGIGVIATLPLIEPYKPYPNLVLVLFVPVSIAFLAALRESADRPVKRTAKIGIGFGVAYGLMCLEYSGWFEWSVPGLFVAAVLLIPWRTSPRNAIYLLAITAALFLLIAGPYLYGVFFDPAAKIVDNYVYFDVKTDPMYVAMWRDDLPGLVGVWPPIGELGGVGLFTIALATGLGLAIAIGRKTTEVIALGSIIAGALVMRFLYAHRLYDTKLVQLYPRTTPLVLYCLLVLCGLGVYWLFKRTSPDSVFRGRSATIGVVCGLLLFFASAGSALSDRYMPLDSDPPGAGWLSMNAHRTKWGENPTYKSRPLHWVRRSVVMTH